MGVVVFDYSRWAVRYPELASSVAENLATEYFDEATLYCDNTDCSPVCDLEMRRKFLGMVTAHIAKLNATLNGEEPSGLVGRISNATEGSVTVATDMQTNPGSEQWFSQTRYGASFWAASAQFRRMEYVVGQNYDPNLFGYHPYVN